MKFNEQFPEMAPHIRWYEAIHENKKEPAIFIADWIIMKEHCLSKQKVKEAIANLRKESNKLDPLDYIHVKHTLDDVEKELGLQ